MGFVWFASEISLIIKVSKSMVVEGLYDLL